MPGASGREPARSRRLATKLWCAPSATLRPRPPLLPPATTATARRRSPEGVRMVSGCVVVDARGHMMGRLASAVAKELLKGQRVAVLRCEEMALSGGLVRRKSRFLRFLRKRTNTKPSHGPVHHRSPARIFWRAVRGMVPHKTGRGEASLARLQAFDGVPPPYDRTKRIVIPDALKVLRLQKGHKYCLLGDLSKEVGWNCQDTIRELEKRKEKAKVAYGRKKQLSKLRVKAEKAAEEKLSSQLDVLASVTYILGMESSYTAM